MQENSVNRLTIDWTMFRASVFGQASSAQTIADTYPAIRVALGLLGDGHSSYRSATGTVIFVPSRSCRASGAGTPTLPGTVGYVRVTSFSGSGSEAAAFTNSIQRELMSADRDNLIGWIVDVRGNGGGNMWPMVAGVGPVLGEGVIGYFIGPTGATSYWEYRDGASWLGGIVQQRVDAPYRLRRERPRVAVLTDNGIASSGEATVIAFRGRPDTRSFGDATCGLSTANAGFTMSDGATLNLTVSVMADRTRTKYGDSIPPDEIVTDPRQVVQRALEWLQSGS
jgi:carboxyl-terminal processing protease